MASLEKLKKYAKQHLDNGEQVVATVLGAYEIANGEWERKGIFVATDRRILFFAKKLIGFDLESFPYSNITSFDMSKGLIGRSISFYASGNYVKLKGIRKGDVTKFVDYIKSAVGKSLSKQDNKTIDSVTDEIRKLAQLRDDGILTEEEFSTKKKTLLGI